METLFEKVRRNFTIATIAVAILCAFIGAIGTYAFAEWRLQNTITVQQVQSLAKDDTELMAYLSSQHTNQPYLESIANLIQSEDRKQISTILPIVIIIAALLSGLIGWWLSRRLLVPIKEAYVSQQRFMQDAAHELRTPLAAISTILQQAEHRTPAKKELPTFIESLGRQARRLSAITTDLLLLEKNDTAGVQIVDIAELLQDVLEELHNTASMFDTNIKTAIPAKVSAKITPDHFVYIAKNIIENAIKFNNRSTKPIEVRLSKRGNGWQLVVKDNGIGIPTSDLPNITQRFYRAKNATKIDGTGLGMAIVAKFVHMYKGNLTVTSKPNRGTTVTVTI